MDANTPGIVGDAGPRSGAMREGNGGVKRVAGT